VAAGPADEHIAHRHRHLTRHQHCIRLAFQTLVHTKGVRYMHKPAHADFVDMRSEEWLVVCETGGALGWKLEGDEVVGLRGAGTGAVHV
jgi:hypothetical protein